MNSQSADLARAVTGPVVLITLGVLFAFDRFTEFRFTQTWPVLLIVLGLLRLAGGRAGRRDRHFQRQAPPDPPFPDPPFSNQPHPDQPPPDQPYKDGPYSNQGPARFGRPRS